MPLPPDTFSQNLARHYRNKYGPGAADHLGEAASIFEENGDLHGRNRMLRLKDELAFLPEGNLAP